MHDLQSIYYSPHTQLEMLFQRDHKLLGRDPSFQLLQASIDGFKAIFMYLSSRSRLESVLCQGGRQKVLVESIPQWTAAARHYLAADIAVDI